MIITVNGQVQAFEAGKLTVSELLARKSVANADLVSVQRNGEFLDRAEYSITAVVDGDEIDFLYFMGGGAA